MFHVKHRLRRIARQDTHTRRPVPDATGNARNGSASDAAGGSSWEPCSPRPFWEAGSLFIQSLGDHKSSDTARGNSTSSADTFSKGKLQSEVSDLLSTKSSTSQGANSEKPWNVASDPGGAESSIKTPKTLIEPSGSIPDCIRQGVDRGNTDVLGFKKGTYNGTAAYLVVLPDASDNSRVTAYVVDAACVSSQTFTPGKVLLTRSFPHS